MHSYNLKPYKPLIYFCIILLGIISIITVYITKETRFFTGLLLSIILLTYHLIYYLGWNKKVKIFQFLLGDFTLRNDVNIDKLIYTNSWLDNEYKYYLIISTFFSIPLVLFASKTTISSLILISLSLLSIGVAFTILSFNYTNVLSSLGKKDSKEKDILFSSARRFFLGSIYSVFLLVILIFMRFLTPLTTVINQDPVQFIGISMNYTVNYVCNVVFIILVAMTLKQFIEGLILSLRVNIKFN